MCGGVWETDMNRREWLGSLTGTATCFLLGGELRADQQQANLNETLRSVLRCRRKVEFQFVDLVTQKVQQGKLPLPLVLSMMKWSLERSRARGDDIPFPYFQEGLRRRAAEIGVTLPAFVAP
jgi:hypothetical protein